MASNILHSIDVMLNESDPLIYNRTQSFKVVSMQLDSLSITLKRLRTLVNQKLVFGHLVKYGFMTNHYAFIVFDSIVIKKSQEESVRVSNVINLNNQIHIRKQSVEEHNKWLSEDCDSNIIESNVQESTLTKNNEFHRFIFDYLKINYCDEVKTNAALTLLNSIPVTSFSPELKKLSHEMGAIKFLISVVDKKLNEKICDQEMIDTWNFMWNLTDEMQLNCEKFMECRGIPLFMKCIRTFPKYNELIRSMLGVVGNVAECKHLRYNMLNIMFINNLQFLLSSESVDISFYTAGILANIIADGVWIWNLASLSAIHREALLSDLRTAISKWKLSYKIAISYNSLKPLLELLKPNIESGAQYWAAWALTNLTRVHSAKYCPMLMSENGIKILKELVSSPNLSFHVNALCLATLYQLERWQQIGNVGDIESSDDVFVFSR